MEIVLITWTLGVLIISELILIKILKSSHRKKNGTPKNSKEGTIN